MTAYPNRKANRMTDAAGSAGPCAFCGHPTSEHRRLDAIHERVAAGDPWLDTLKDYGLTADTYFDLVARVTQAESPDQ